MSGTTQRDLVANIASSDPERALRLARAIDDPWFRCQALSYAAIAIESADRFRSTVAEAFRSAELLPDANRVVTVSSWPLKVLALRKERARLAMETRRLLALAATEPSPVRRADALQLVFGATVSAEREVVVPVLEAFVAACLQPLQDGKRNRKGESLLVTCIGATQRIHPEMAQRIVAQLTATHAQQAAREIARTAQMSLDGMLSFPNIGGG
ncbi:MAG: hypothetical protein JOZ54_21520 [Acidobacteria bacterium]|nr:hypothetical protein [Acidobacteriota bacterium]